MPIEVTWYEPLISVSALTNVHCVGETGVVFADTAAALVAVPASLCLRYAFVYGFFVKNDGMGFEAYWDRTSTDAADGSTIFNPTGNAGPGRWFKRL